MGAKCFIIHDGKCFASHASARFFTPNASRLLFAMLKQAPGDAKGCGICGAFCVSSFFSETIRKFEFE